MCGPLLFTSPHVFRGSVLESRFLAELLLGGTHGHDGLTGGLSALQYYVQPVYHFVFKSSRYQLGDQGLASPPAITTQNDSHIMPSASFVIYSAIMPLVKTYVLLRPFSATAIEYAPS